jgi:transcription-repair coupling factor (superfamily II helicase)
VNHLRKAFEAELESETLRRVADRLREGTRVLSVPGPTGGARALAIAASVLAEGRPAIVLCASDTDARNFSLEIGFFLELLQPSPPLVRHLPSLEVDPYRGLSPHPEIAAERARTLWHLIHDERVVVVCSARAAAVRLHSPARFLSHCLELKRNDEQSVESLREHLHRAGYVEDDPVTDPGEFSMRGGIVDVFPPQMEKPVRLEFFGDTLDSLRLFDPETQRSTSTVDNAEIIPMREYCPRRELLARWAAEAPLQWAEPFRPHLLEETAMARQGEAFAGFEFMLPAIDPLEHSIFDYAAGFRLITIDREVVETALARHHAELYERYLDRIEALKPVLAPEQVYLSTDQFQAAVSRFPRIELEELRVERDDGVPVAEFTAQSTRRYHGNIHELTSDLARFRAVRDRVVFLFSNLGRAERVNDILREYEIPAHLCRPDEMPGDGGPIPPGVVLLGVGQVHSGFFLPDTGLRVLTAQDVFDEADVGAAPRRARKSQRQVFLSDFRDLKPGDYVVHIDHGIGIFHGLKSIPLQEGSKEFVLLTYQGDARLYVPVERLDLIQKYSSVGGARPALDKLGGTSWERTKTRIKKSMRDMAGELLKLYAERQMVQGHSFSADTAWQQEFEDAFEFDLTADQEDAISSVKVDMEAPLPMDRLLCGDVGYGKTEVAMRAAFKAVMDGKQVAILAPTTVLAFQHFNTFRQRFTVFPVRIQLLSRFRSPKEQKQVLADLESGAVDIVIGTHRLLSKDVAFKDLGLVIVDEEQRFGVAHKERLKALKTRVDVLTLTATPIPRTLNMAMLGLRDMSTIETPPKDRLAIQTSVVRYSKEVVRSAIELELARNGQVYFVHNRVETIYSVAAMVQQLVPKARVGVAHGQMSERDLEKIMLRFVQDELDVLVATTIIENGLDIPRANTMVIDRADLYGLAQLYQLRGRVGRSDRRAYAYLLIPGDEVLSDVARKRLAAIREFSDLGTGFRVAALDLEIRGAGNLLGGEQHGQIDAVGFDLYCQLLEHAVQELRGQKPEIEIQATLNLNLDIRIPEDYIQDSSQRLRMYKRVSSAVGTESLDNLRQELVDRFGAYPEPVANLFRYARLRQDALALQIQSIERQRHQVFIRFVDESRVDATKLLALVTKNRRAALSPQGILTLDVGDLGAERLFETLHTVLDRIRL